MGPRPRPLAGLAVAVVAVLGAASLAGCVPDGEGVGVDEQPAVERERGAVVTSMPLTVDSGSVERARRIVYSSRDAHGAGTVVSGSVLEPAAPWTGDGPRPLMVIAPGTQGTADNCAPSLLMQFGTAPPPPSQLFLDLGWAVAITDYEGLGTPGPHTYLVREAQGNAVLDMAVAAADLLGGGEIPTAIFGFSQGGGAAAAAAEMAADRAADRGPAIDLRAVYAGGVPADLPSTTAEIDGSPLAGAMGYAINGLVAAYPEVAAPIDEILNDAGRAFVADTADQCVGATLEKWGGRDSRDFTADGRPLAKHLAEGASGAGASGAGAESADRALHDAVDAQRLGRRAPAVPVFVTHNAEDDVIPVAGARRLVRDWCDAGANVTYVEVSEDLGDASHGLAWQLTVDEAFAWLVAVMGGPNAPGVPGTC